MHLFFTDSEMSRLQAFKWSAIAHFFKTVFCFGNFFFCFLQKEFTYLQSIVKFYVYWSQESEMWNGHMIAESLKPEVINLSSKKKKIVGKKVGIL